MGDFLCCSNTEVRPQTNLLLPTFWKGLLMTKENADHRNPNNVPQAPADAGPAVLLSWALSRLIEMSDDKLSDGFAEHTMPLLYKMGQLETKQQQLIYSLEVIRKQLEVLASNNKLLENAGSTNQLLGEQHYEDHIIQPLVRAGFPVFDIIEDARKSWKAAGEDLDKQVLEFIDAVWTQLKQLLVNYDVHIVRHRSGDLFEPQEMKPIRWIPTDSRMLEGRVADSLQIGFKSGGQRVLRLESVSLFKYQPSKIKTVTSNERGES